MGSQKSTFSQLVTLHQAQNTCNGTAYGDDGDKMWTYLATFDEIRKKGNVEEVGEIVDEGLKIVWPRKTGEQAPEVYTISYL